jgi:hypothetical protein
MEVEIEKVNEGYKVTMSNKNILVKKRKVGKQQDKIEKAAILEKLFDIMSPGNEIKGRGADFITGECREIFFRIKTNKE